MQNLLKSHSVYGHKQMWVILKSHFVFILEVLWVLKKKMNIKLFKSYSDL